MRKFVITTLIALNLGTLSIFAAGSSTNKPTILEKTQPSYPEHSMTAGVEGKVIVECLITSDGQVVGATAVRAPNAELAEAAVIAVSQWKFAPAEKDGQPTEAVVHIPVEFKLQTDERGELVPSIIARN